MAYNKVTLKESAYIKPTDVAEAYGEEPYDEDEGYFSEDDENPWEPTLDDLYCEAENSW